MLIEYIFIYPFISKKILLFIYYKSKFYTVYEILSKINIKKLIIIYFFNKK
jgi:hypothetical protein